MRVDEGRQHGHAVGLDHLGAGRLEPLADGGDDAARDVQVGDGVDLAGRIEQARAA